MSRGEYGYRVIFVELCIHCLSTISGVPDIAQSSESDKTVFVESCCMQ
jgi:hypothetical protein